MHLICLILLVSFTILPVYAQNNPLEGNSVNANQTDRSFCSQYLNEAKEICIESTWTPSPGDAVECTLGHKVLDVTWARKTYTLNPTPYTRNPKP